MSQANESPSETLFTLMRERLDSLDFDEQEKFRRLLRDFVGGCPTIPIRLLSPQGLCNGAHVYVEFDPEVDEIIPICTSERPLACVALDDVAQILKEVKSFTNKKQRCNKKRHEERDKKMLPEIAAGLAAGHSLGVIANMIGKKKSIVKSVRYKHRKVVDQMVTDIENSKRSE
jgi:hypothetical protein